MIKGKPLTSVIDDRAWLEGEFIKVIQSRRAQIIQAREKSSAASAKLAIIHSWLC